MPGSSPALIGLKVVLSEILGCVIWQAAYLRISPEYREGAMALLGKVQETVDREMVPVCMKRFQQIQLAMGPT